jgi:hypothetical protein
MFNTIERSDVTPRVSLTDVDHIQIMCYYYQPTIIKLEIVLD